MDSFANFSDFLCQDTNPFLDIDDDEYLKKILDDPANRTPLTPADLPSSQQEQVILGDDCGLFRWQDIDEILANAPIPDSVIQARSDIPEFVLPADSNIAESSLPTTGTTAGTTAGTPPPKRSAGRPRKEKGAPKCPYTKKTNRPTPTAPPKPKRAYRKRIAAPADMSHILVATAATVEREIGQHKDWYQRCNGDGLWGGAPK